MFHSLACRCARKAKKNGFKYFGLQYYGECFSGAEAGTTFDKYGETEACVNSFYGECENPKEGECVGKSLTNFVYKLKEGMHLLMNKVTFTTQCLLYHYDIYSDVKL